jgi:hypothetical protein
MIPVLASAMIDVTGGPDGGHVLVDPPVAWGVVCLFILLLPLLVLLVLSYYRSKFRHQQILAAMEKGVPVSELMARPAHEINWVRNLSAGIGFLFIAVVMTILFFVARAVSTDAMRASAIAWLVIPAVIFGLGLIFLLRGILQRNCEKSEKKG